MHEIELGDGWRRVMEIYATPTAPNAVDEPRSRGVTSRRKPAGRSSPIRPRHAKEILVTDLDGDGRDELYVAVEAVPGGRVEILCFRPPQIRPRANSSLRSTIPYAAF